MIKFIALLTPAMLVTLLVLWCTAASAATYSEENCVRRPLANGRIGETVLECTLKRVPDVCLDPARGSRALCSHTKGEWRTYGARVGTTTIVARLGVRG
jgi:hypothetical protein